ncbi:PREDICTED: procollagen C-endopeptidase enhancer 2-like [Branchiostoma belcheri]|uniref:Procollagen C-endopeptidase enhancer 2-like n=1 Tax=Branchiostoma belcheri TaxID=7741 RepID=A0A6P4YE49_BRABE|nr:PREDICTED: procollagen C-endopeptidase enhancer 2-like [Branchiostoma belcheri]XP_019615211.1 PREDICTED: procollagen C-endopeptidase enhancer 2-like [Branchiostoma belcheri]
MYIAALLALLAVIRPVLPETICDSPLLIATSSPGVLTSDGYPGLYPAGTDCTCELRGTLGNVVEISFNDFLVDPSPGSLSGAPGTCSRHYLEVYNGLETNGNLLGSFCGDETPPILLSSDVTLTLKFVTNPWSANNRYRGFSLNYTAIAGSQGPDLDSGCWSMRRLTAPSGTIVSPGFPVEYPASLACTWEIVTHPDSKITLQFLTFLVGGISATCDNNVNDYVIVYRGTGESKESEGTYCGWELPQFTDLLNEVTIEFVSNNVGGFRGFFVVYTAVGPTTTPAPPPTITTTVPPPVNTMNTPQPPVTPGASYVPTVGDHAARLGDNIYIMILFLLVAILTPIAR